MWMGGKETDVQIIVTRNISETDGLLYTKNLLKTFDLDICKMAIYDNEYVKVGGGQNTFFIFMDDKVRRDRGMARSNSYSPKTLERAKKYVSRLNYNFFCQFSTKLEDMDMAEFEDTMTNQDYEEVSHIRFVNEE